MTPRKGVRQRIDPAHLAFVRSQQRLLARTQAAREIDDGVARTALPKRIEQLQRQGARAGAKLPDLVGAGARQGLAHLHGQRLAKQGRHLGGGHKIAARLRQGAKFRALVGVVAQARRVQGQLHEAVETDPATGPINGLRDVGLQGGR
jgi:hypothetical protein